MHPLLIALYGIVGAVVGSFCNVVIDRVPAKQSLLAPRSRCPGCGRQLSILELLPVVSYLALRGKCRTCGQAIPPRVVLVETITGVLFALALALFGWGFETIAVSLAVLFCVVLFVMDLEAMYVYDAIVYPAIAVALLIAVGRMLLGQVRFSQAGMLWGWLARSVLPGLTPAQAGAISQGLGGAIGFLLFWLRVWGVHPGRDSGRDPAGPKEGDPRELCAFWAVSLADDTGLCVSGRRTAWKLSGHLAMVS